MVWWLAGFAGLLVLAGYAVRRVLRGRGTGTDPNYLPLYLDNDAVMNLYEMGNYRTAMRREVEERRIRNAGCLAVIPFVSVLFKVVGGTSTEVISKYLEETKPMSVIGLLLSVLRSKDGLVEVRLWPRPVTVTPNLAEDDVALTEIGEFVMVTGRFEEREGTDETRVMRAPYGDAEPPSAYLRVVLRRDGLRTPDRKLPEGQFQAHCLGKVGGWNPQTREIFLEYPIAVFR